MSRKKRHLRIAAIFCLLTFLQSIVLPPVAHALTSGPTVPETSSFEPVDATDMVNLQTGDLSYNLPVLEVPGPEGSYPLSLAYHAGIKPLEEASWVGLGWNLNAGAINRVVNGYADDHKNITRTVTDYWAGGESATFSIGVGFGVPNSPLGMGLNLALSNDTYQGFNGDVGFSLSIGALNVSGNGNGLSAGAGGNIGPLKYGVSTDFKGNLNYAASAAAKLGFSSIEIGVKNGAGYLDASAFGALGIKMKSNSSKSDFTIGRAATSTHNNNYKLSTSTSGFNLTIPIKAFYVNLGYSYRRYWIHETDQAKTYGTFYAKDSEPDFLTAGKGIYDQQISFDSYALLDLNNNVIDHPDPEWLWGGSYPAYDAYQVMAQGLGGSIQPYLFENGSLYRKQITNTALSQGELAFRLPKAFTQNASFKAVNDFSSSFTLGSSSPKLNLSDNNPSADPLSYSAPSGGFNASLRKLAGSKNIETFTNSQIRYQKSFVRSKGFIDYPGLSDTERTTGDKTDQVGGYSITTKSGVTYHYALPVYAYGEVLRSEKPNPGGAPYYNTQNNTAPYAYTWLLTAITGPDFIDRNNNGSADGFANEGDYGYWVTFDYGQWLSNFKWRTPFVGKNTDISKLVEHYSYGQKEVYYLDAIKTRTHTALFVKDIRHDGKDVTSNAFGGFAPREGVVETVTGCVDDNYFPTGNDTRVYALKHFAKSLMKLDKIVLLKNKDLPNSIDGIRALNNPYDYTMDMPVTDVISGGDECEPCCTTYPITASHNGNKVIDVEDYLDIESSISAKLIKLVEFNTDYSLAPETPNSFISSAYYTSNPTTTNKGKLTLKSISFKGKGGTAVLPATNFDYNDPGPQSRTYDILSTQNNSGSNSYGQINISGAAADVMHKTVNYYYSGKEYYLYVFRDDGNDEYRYRVLGKNLPSNSHAGNFLYLTKNPPFSGSAYDSYGYYKPEFIYSNQTTGPTDMQRLSTPRGGLMLDAWSLKEIETPVGAKIKIKYSPKTFNTLVTQPKMRMNVKTMNWTYNSGDKFEIKFEEDFLPSEFFSVNDQIEVTFQLGTSPSVQTKVLTVTEVFDSPFNTHRYIQTNFPFANSNSVSAITRGFVDFDCTDCHGDGIKVDEIEVTDGTRSRKTLYTYANGTNAYVPTFGHNPKPETDTDGQELYVKKFHENLMELYVLAREIPSPGVMYKNVEVSETENGLALPGKKKYEFRTFEEDMVTIDYGSVQYSSVSGNIEEMAKRKVTIKDKTAQIGNLLSYELVDDLGQSVSKVVNDYADDESNESESDYATYDNQGVIHQGFNEMRTKFSYPNGISRRYIKGVESVREEFPNVLKSSETTADGSSRLTYNRKYDIFSGELVESEVEDSYGQHFLTKKIPAYKKYADMGLKNSNSDNKHMLSQNTAAYTYRSDGNGNITGNPLSASVTTWSNDWSYRDYQSSAKNYVELAPPAESKHRIYRKHEMYDYKSAIDANGTLTNFTDFNWSGNPVAAWNKTDEITRYDHYSKPLEMYGIDDNYVATKLGYEETLPLTTAAPAKYVEIAFSGAEDRYTDRHYFGGEVRAPNENTIVSSPTHTGKKSVKLNAYYRYGMSYHADVNAVSGTQYAHKIDRKPYEARVWVHQSNISNSYNYLFCSYKNSSNTSLKWIAAKVSDESTIKVGEWYQLRLAIDFNDPVVASCTKIEVGTWVNSISSDTYFDDFRFSPVDADITSYVYDQVTDQVTYILNKDHFFTQYVYDAGGRLLRVYQETPENPTGKRLVSETDYNFKRPY